mmetsp:Transcript_30022/g.49186  ORF Transcript_30022/g.49186 Transcript_30022/m.49186 type:complete len:227 (+) Transcript_30022:1316-1996(+)
MSYFNTATAFIGNEDSCGIDAAIELKTNNELFQIAEHTQNSLLMHNVIINQMYVHCYFREYLPVTDLAEKYQMSTRAKRVLDFYFVFFEGISALCLARDTKQDKWRKIGEKNVRSMTQLLEYSTWNFENKLSLLQAELHYLNHRHTMAELSYQAAIVSAHDHKFFHEEALAHELYGIYLVENKIVVKGMGQLQMSIDKYNTWGATKKADAVKDFIHLVNQPVNLWK